MKKTVALLTGIVGLAIAAPALAQPVQEQPLPYGQVVAGPTNPWPAPAAGAKKFRVFFAVETLTAGARESVWGLWASKGCIRMNLFPRREGVVWHISAVDIRTGEVVEPEDVRYAYLKIPGAGNLKLKYGPHGKDPKTAPWNWYYRWDIPPDYPLGAVAYQVVFKLKDMKAGEVATYTEIPLAPELLTVVEERLPL